MARPRFDIVPNGYDTLEIDVALDRWEPGGLSAAGWVRVSSGLKLPTRDLGYDIEQVNEYLLSLVKPPVRLTGPAAAALWPPRPPRVGRHLPTITRLRAWAARGTLILIASVFVLLFVLINKSDRLGLGDRGGEAGTASISECRSTGWSLESPYLCDATVRWRKEAGDDYRLVHSEEVLSGEVAVEQRCTLEGRTGGTRRLTCVTTTLTYPLAKPVVGRLWLTMCLALVLGVYPGWWAAGTLRDRKRQQRTTVTSRESDRGLL
ncbi:hypothetical protein R8Z50_29225 [Longispora sp. K20-0274]|uniref:hypothetical protein n=1 Tax=Longispora sp. K20-0274 TaxID=3088255 RepID=UPI00399C0DCD